MDEIRSQCGGLLIGSNTLCIDNPTVTLKNESPQPPLPITVTRHPSRLPPDLRFFQSPRRALVISPEEPSGLPCEWLKSDTDAASIVRVVRERGIHRLLLEGGAVLAASFFAADLIDRIFLTMVPYVLGGNASGKLFNSVAFELERCERKENEVFLEYGRKGRQPGSI